MVKKANPGASNCLSRSRSSDRFLTGKIPLLKICFDKKRQHLARITAIQNLERIIYYCAFSQEQKDNNNKFSLFAKGAAKLQNA